MCNKKVCSKCGRELPLNEDFFAKRKVSKDGFRGVCRECNGHSFKVKDFETSKKETKKCRTCNQEHPLNEEYFSKSTRTSDGFKTICKSCEVKVIRSTTKSICSKDELRDKIKDVKDGYKICLCCGKELPISREYFQGDISSHDGLNSKCKECTGSSYEERNYENWNEEDLNILKEKFPNTPDIELPNLITSHSYDSIRSTAHKLGLKKDEAYIGFGFYKGFRSQKEYLVNEILTRNGYVFEREYNLKNIKNDFDMNLYIDFYLENNIAIEYQGRQHYVSVDIFGGDEGLKKQIANDNIKRKFCEENKIRLIEIPYYIDDIEEYLLTLL